MSMFKINIVIDRRSKINKNTKVIRIDAPIA